MDARMHKTQPELPDPSCKAQTNAHINTHTSTSLEAKLLSPALYVVINTAAAPLAPSMPHQSRTLRQAPGGHLSRPWGLSYRLHGDHR